MGTTSTPPEKSPLETVLAYLEAHRPAVRTLETGRAFMEAMMAMEPVAADVEMTPLKLGEVGAEKLTTPGADAALALLYLHGGGYSLGTAAGYRPLGAKFARAFAGPVFVLDYRLAPEHPFPAGLDDAVRAYDALLASGVPAARIAVAGDSAGGGLAVALAVRLRAEQKPLPAALGLLSPWVDLEGNTPSMLGGVTDDPIVSREGMLILAERYLGGAKPTDPLAAPTHADLRGLPPMIVHVGTRETQLDQVLVFTEQARAAGVEVTQAVWPGMIHVFQGFPAFPEAQQSIDQIGAALRAHAQRA